MKAFFKKAVNSLLLVPAIVFGVGVLAPVTVSAATTTSPVAPSSSCGDISQGITAGAGCAHPQTGAGPENLFGAQGIFTTIVNILLYIIGAIAVIMLIIGGIRYVTSGGDSSAVTAAKNTILYAIIGIIVALLAYAVVNFVLVNLAQ